MKGILTWENTRFESPNHRALDLVLENHQVLVASHNRHSIERTIQKMAELGVSQVGVDGRMEHQNGAFFG